MIKKRFKRYTALFFAVFMLLSACSNDNGDILEPDNSVDRSENEGGILPSEIAADTVVEEIKNLFGAAEKKDFTFPIGQPLNGGSFIGTAYLAPMIANEQIYNFPQTNNITFEPGARSGWHSHGGMIIIVTGGVGYYQEEGQPAQIIRKGDIVECEPGIKHWHGAASDSWFSQLVIYDSHYSTDSLGEPVTDEQYENLISEEYKGRTENNDGFMFPKAENTMTSPTFSGAAYVSSLIGNNNAAGAPNLHYVVFEPGVINNWHSHEGGQILIVTDGVGYHQIEGQQAEVLYPGDVAYCPPGVKHWHGGSANTEFAHIAINTNPENSGVEWFERITEEEYKALPKQ
ncbi:MAG: cupin domain-containing protein [Firmicutes bacterium]|nr:cupin domain-containing protein [[Eubacterium] siraeum]MCM1488890.1 cupin domain-containing protein [Bacillota bacterium]